MQHVKAGGLGVLLALAVLGTGRIAHAQASQQMMCWDVWREYTALMIKTTQQALACSRSVVERNLHRIVDLQKEDPDETVYTDGCSYSVKRSCAPIARQCMPIARARADAFQKCQRNAAASVDRQTNQHVPFKGTLEQSGRDIGKYWAVDTASKLLVPDSPFRTIRESTLLQAIGAGVRVHQRVERTATVVDAVRQLLSGDQPAQERAAFALTGLFDDRAISATNNPAAGVFATYSFMALSNIRQELARELQNVRSSIELFGVEQSLARYRSDVIFSQTQTQWAATRALTDASYDRDDVSMPMHALLQQFFQDVQKLEAAFVAEQRRRAAAAQAAAEARAEAARATEAEAAKARARARARAEAERRAAEAAMDDDDYVPSGPTYVPSTPIFTMPNIPYIPPRASPPTYQQRPSGGSGGSRSNCPPYRGRGTPVDCNP
jgi:hypothetical protein